MPTKARPVSNNVIACLEAITALVITVRPTLEAASDRAEQIYQDPILLGQIVRIERTVNDIGHHARNARNNRYEERRPA